ncbi:MAG TPA: LptE family protein [Verrucomicrobiae bacterium]|jgi:hypothetical protein
MRALKFIFPVLAAMLLAGCAGYHLGAVNGAVAGEKTVEVQPFNNQTMQPRLGDDVTQALRERFQADATYRLVTGSPGDVVVSGVIRTYQREALGFLKNDSSTPQNYRVGVMAHVTARDRATGKVLLDRDVKGHTFVNVGSDFAGSERQASPLLAADLAQNITALLAEGAW